MVVVGTGVHDTVGHGGRYDHPVSCVETPEQRFIGRRRGTGTRFGTSRKELFRNTSQETQSEFKSACSAAWIGIGTGRGDELDHVSLSYQLS